MLLLLNYGQDISFVRGLNILHICIRDFSDENDRTIVKITEFFLDSGMAVDEANK